MSCGAQISRPPISHSQIGGWRSWFARWISASIHSAITWIVAPNRPIHQVCKPRAWLGTSVCQNAPSMPA
jgi:hypothetical protein